MSHDGSVVVRWKGLPGWTAAMLNECINDPNVGLQPVLDRNPSLSLVIILVGTNDIGTFTSTSIGADFDVGEAISPILKLHQACLESLDDNGDQTLRTIALGIPTSLWQEMNSDAARLRVAMNDRLRKFADANERVTYVDFPFSFQRGSPNWSPDGLHFSPEGYQLLGHSLSTAVGAIIESGDEKED